MVENSRDKEVVATVGAVEFAEKGVFVNGKDICTVKTISRQHTGKGLG